MEYKVEKTQAGFGFDKTGKESEGTMYAIFLTVMESFPTRALTLSNLMRVAGTH